MLKLKRYLPPPQRLCVSMRQRSKEFLRENTLHGFAYFVNGRRPLWERIAWFVCTAASFAAVVGIILTIWEKFDSDPALMGLDTETEDWVTHFPSVTICQPNPDFNFAAYEREPEHYASMYKWSWQSSKDENALLSVDLLPGQTYSQIFYDAAPDCQHLFDNCTYFGKAVSCEEMFLKVMTSRGPCCFVHAKKITRETRPWEISFRSNAYPIGIELSEVTGTWQEREAPFWYYATNGISTRISMLSTYVTAAIESIPPRRRECHLPEEYPSYEACLHECRISRALAACRCVPWFLRALGTIQSHQECTRSHDYSCLRDQSHDFIKNKTCLCYLPCNHTTYLMEELEYRTDDVVEIHMNAWPAVLYKRDVRFGWLDLLVSFGGIAGLFLGYSLLTSIELTYYFFLRTYCGAVLVGPADEVRKTFATDGENRRRRRRRRRGRQYADARVLRRQNVYYDYAD